MVNDSDYKQQYLDQRFGDIDKTLNRIERQTTLTNSRVTHLEEKTGTLEKKNIEHIITCPVLPKVEVIEQKMIGLESEKRVKTTMKEWGGRIRTEKRAEVMKTLQTIGIVIAAIGMMITAYNTFRGNSITSRVDSKVDMINVPVRTRSGSIEFWPSGVTIDSLQENNNMTDVKEIKELVK